MMNHGQASVTGHPSNESELQLYGVLQRAKLLSYFDTFIAQGGDDVHQLCEAGEEEFLEIMALVGMASKPLHVRRLQKALQEWVQNPSLFQASLMPLSSFSSPAVTPSAIHSPIAQNFKKLIYSVGHHPLPILPSVAPLPTSAILPTHSLATHLNPRSPSPLLVPSRGTSRSQATQGPSQLVPLPSQSPTLVSQPSSAPHTPSPAGSMSAKEPSGQGGEHSPAYSQGCLEYPMMSTSPLQLTPTLNESQIARIAETSARLVKALPSSYEPNAKQLNKKKLSKELEGVITMSNNDNHKMDEIRKFSAIYGRFDCKRKPEKPLTLHEVSVNEAAAQLCFLLPGLLMRRDKLFHLARKVVRDSGYQYSKGHSRSQFQADASDLLGTNTNGGDDNSSRDSSTAGGDNGNGVSEGKSKRSARHSDNDEFEVRSSSSKRRKDSENEETDFRRRERFEHLSDEIHFINEKVEELQNALRQTRDAAFATAISEQLELLNERRVRKVQEQKEHSRAFHSFGRFSGRISTMSDAEHNDSDDDSQLSYSNHSSPIASPKSVSCQQQHAGTFVLSARGSQIIAVQNPALSMSGSILRSTPSTSSPHHHVSSSHHQHMTPTSTLTSPLSTLLNASRKDEGPNESDFHKSNLAMHHLRELRSSRSISSANDSDLKEDSSLISSQGSTRRRSPTPNS